VSQTLFVDYAQMPVLGDIAHVHGRDRPQAVALSFEGRETNYAALGPHPAEFETLQWRDVDYRGAS
jgi:hypothetical protein